MNEAGVVRRGRQLCGEVTERLRSHGVELVPFLTVGCLVVAFWCALSLPAIVGATGLREKPVTPKTIRPTEQLRVIASVGGATMPEARQLRSSNGPTKASRERGETPMPPTLFIAVR